jgi:hypothetical protein
MALTISQATLDQAKTLAEQGDIAGAWNVLSEGGDTYPANANMIIAAR